MDGTAEMIFSGDELLRGDTLNTNQAYLGERLLDLGFLSTRALCVTDDLATLTRVIQESLSRGPAVLVLSGGLGPTEDDLTREAVSAALDLPLEHHEDLLSSIRARFASRGLTMSDTNRKQASLPRGAVALDFSGTAPGFALEHDHTLLVALPGVPWELKDMWQTQVDPLLRTRPGAGAAGAAGGLAAAGSDAEGPAAAGTTGSPAPEAGAAGPKGAAAHGADRAAAHEVRRLRAFGVGESVLAQKLAHLDWHDPEATIGTRANLDGITVILRGRATEEGRRKLEAVQDHIVTALGEHIYSLTNQDLQVVVSDLLRDASLTVAVAESCTGGLLAKRLTDLPGSSDYFLGGVVAYDNRVKTEVLGVPAQTLIDKGAVSEEVAAAMAEGVCRAIGADCGVSTTGIAGPDGGTDEKPVGLVCIGSVVKGVTQVERMRMWGARDQVRERAAFSALDLLRRRLLSELPGSTLSGDLQDSGHRP